MLSFHFIKEVIWLCIPPLSWSTIHAGCPIASMRLVNMLRGWGRSSWAADIFASSVMKCSAQRQSDAIRLELSYTTFAPLLAAGSSSVCSLTYQLCITAHSPAIVTHVYHLPSHVSVFVFVCVLCVCVYLVPFFSAGQHFVTQHNWFDAGSVFLLSAMSEM